MAYRNTVTEVRVADGPHLTEVAKKRMGLELHGALLQMMLAEVRQQIAELDGHE